MGRLVLVGGGHVHAGVLFQIEDMVLRGHEVTVVNPTPLHYYSGMGPGVLGGTYRPEDIAFPVKDMTKAGGGEFVEDKVTGVDPMAKTLSLASGKTLSYDVLSFNAGSVIPRPRTMPEEENDIYPVKPIQNLWKARERIKTLLDQGPVRVVVVGGGPAALEVAGNAKAVTRAGKCPDVTVLAGRRFLSRLPGRVRSLAMANFRRRGIEVREDGYAQVVKPGSVALESGREFKADIVFLALGVHPPDLFEESGLPTGPDGGLTVNRYLQCVDHPAIFGGGDCIYFLEQPLDKVGVYAVRQHQALVRNLGAALDQKPLTPFDPGGAYLLVFNLGDGTGIFWKWKIVFNGKPGFLIKDYIDRRFMRLFAL